MYYYVNKMKKIIPVILLVLSFAVCGDCPAVELPLFF